MADVTIIGGGIVGICCGLALQGRGLKAEIVDPGDLRRGASYGNCGLLATGEVVPISKPGVLRRVPGWLLDPEGPLFLRPRALVSQMPWLLRFLAAGRPDRIRQIAHDLARLTRSAEEDYRGLFARLDMAEELVTAENLMVYNGRSDYEADRTTWALRRECGFDYVLLTVEELRQLEPALGQSVTCGALLKGWLQFADPGRTVQRLQDAFLASGGILHRASVQKIETSGRKAVALHLQNGQRHPLKSLVLAAGAWSGPLARDLGIFVPVAALQGYHRHLPNPGVTLNRAVLYANGGFVATPMATGLRIGGTIEIAGQDPRPDFRRAEVITRKAAALLPGLNTAGGIDWMGPRPFMPDTLPVIGRAPGQDNATLALGHGQLGMTIGATTGRLVAELVEGRPSLDLSPYDPERFGRNRH